MNRFSSIFGQILHLFSKREFFETVHRTQAERGAKGFNCWDQFVAMLFCQLGQAHSLREICGGLASCFGKAKHLGLQRAPKRSTLSYANEHRPWQLYEQVFYQLLGRCQQLGVGRRKFRFRNKLFSLDATVIELCASLFDWAKFRQTKGAVKLHLLLDHDGYLPVFAHITDGKTHEVKVAQTMVFPSGSIVAIDKGYVDYELFWRWTQSGVFFVTRQKDNARYAVAEERPLPRHRNILSDQVIELEGYYSHRKYPGRLRRIEVWDEENGKVITLLTNHLTFGSTTIGAIYKDRWQIEIFFKTIKQNLRIKTFVGTSPNALMIQIWTALIEDNYFRRRRAMVRKEDSRMIDVVHAVCCGLDVHKDKVSAYLIFHDAKGKEQSDVKEFGTFTDDLIRMREWLLTHGCPVLAMESTGVYWRPVYNILEDYLRVILVNPRDIKNVPGRKTDISDSKWIAGVLKHGLLRGSFIPPKEVRQWRDLTRMRRRYVQTAADYRRRTQKLFESANIKIDSVVADLFGVSGRNLMNLLISGRELSLAAVQGCRKGHLKRTDVEIFRAIQGFFMDHHRFQLCSLLRMVEYLEKEIACIDEKIRLLMRGHEDILERLRETHGISEIASRDILAELGPTLDAFPTDAALASWSGLCPSNNESDGKRRSGRSRVFKHHLKTIMVEVAWAAVRTKGSYYKDKYYWLKYRIGAKKALIAVAHRILKAIYRIIKEGAHFRDLGEEYLTLKNKSKKVQRLKKQAQILGFELAPHAV